MLIKFVDLYKPYKMIKDEIGFGEKISLLVSREKIIKTHLYICEKIIKKFNEDLENFGL